MNQPPRGTLSRADLLRWLAAMPRPSYPGVRSDWAYELQPESAEAPEERGAEFLFLPSDEDLTPPSPVVHLPLQMSEVPFVVAREGLASQVATPPPEPALLPLSAADRPRGASASCRQTALIPAPRLLPGLHRHLGDQRLGGMDVAQLVKALAKNETPRYLPRQRVMRWPTSLHVLLDLRTGLRPYWHDMQSLAKALVRFCGSDNVSIRYCRYGPQGPSKDWQAVQRDAINVGWARSWTLPPRGSRVLLVSDFGVCSGADSLIARQWLECIAALDKQGVRALALAPVGAEQLPAELTRALPLIRWSPDASPHPLTSHRCGNVGQPLGLDELMAMAATMRRIDPPLLRALRQLNSQAPHNAGLEGAIWNHPDTEGENVVWIAPEALPRHLERFKALSTEIQAKVHRLQTEHHQHFGEAFASEETLLWAAHAAPEVGAGEAVETSKKFLARLAQTLKEGSPGDPATQAYWQQIAREMLARSDATMADAFPEFKHLALSMAERRALPRQLPDWIDPSLLDGGGETVWPKFHLVWDASAQCLRLQKQPASRGQSPLAGDFGVGAAGFRLEGAGRPQWRQASTDIPLSCLKDQTLVLRGINEILTLASVPRPRGVASWWQTRDGLVIQSPPIGEMAAVWQAADLSAEKIGEEWRLVGKELRQRVLAALKDGKPRWNIDWGLDRYGVFADVTVRASREATQRFRWIEPGHFLMGSPADEPGRFDNEGPQHPVTLTQGYWLADTACTQLLWEAVMGGNPSYFKGEDLPVEKVRWDDVQTFLSRLEDLLPGCTAELPSEAEWEYACRAGTTTAYAFGEQIEKHQANFANNETVAVKKFPPNAWGLYQMHGNVLEWCADGLRTYDGEAQVDPWGPGRDAPAARRALRGGSWLYGARGLRSAFRFAHEPGDRDNDLGFRFVLRSIEPGQGRPRRPAVPSRDAAAVGEKSRAERAPRKKSSKG